MAIWNMDIERKAHRVEPIIQAIEMRPAAVSIILCRAALAAQKGTYNGLAADVIISLERWTGDLPSH